MEERHGSSIIKEKKGFRQRLKQKALGGKGSPGEHQDLAQAFETARNHLVASRYDEFITFLTERPYLSTYQCRVGTTLLHVAATGTNTEAVRQLIHLRADPNWLDLSQRSPLLDAVRHHAPLEIITALIDAKADPAYCANQRSVIHYASRGVEGNLPVLVCVLEAIDSKDRAEAINYLLSDAEPFMTALDFAQNPQIQALLTDSGALTGKEYITKIRNDIELSRVGDTLRAKGYAPKYPCLMLPGTCSSALEIWHSETKPGWVGSRLWIDPTKLGLKIGLKNKSAEDIAFLEHMRLEDDGLSDPPGICVRPVEGVHGLDYLIGSGPAAIRHQSVVWGEVVNVLASIGYSANNLMGFTYDWRLAPEALQKRDAIFLKLKMAVEYLATVNKERVALVGHSMGCKFGQFFLHWAEAEAGRSWIDKYVQTFIAIGAPWSGAPKIVRALLSGDSMGLPTTFLFGTRYLVAMSRTFSSSLWLLPFGENGDCVYFDENGTFRREHWNLVLPMYDENFASHCDTWYKHSPYMFNDQEEEELMRHLQAPYVDSLHCIYGINAKELPNFSGEAGTEVGSYYTKRKTPFAIGNKKIMWKRCKTSSHQDGKRTFVKDGIVKERPLPGLPSGDGTVPYESLSWATKWIGQPDAPVVKQYEFDGVCHRETILEPAVLHLLGELLCGGEPQEIRANENGVEDIFSKPLSHVFTHLADENGVPYLVSCVLHSLRATNAISQKGIMLKPGVQEDVVKQARVFLTWKHPTNDSLNSIYPHTRSELLKRFIRSMDTPLLSMEGFDSLTAVKNTMRQDSFRTSKVQLNELRKVIKDSKFYNLACELLNFFHGVAFNPVNEVTAIDLASEYLTAFFWSQREDKEFLLHLLTCLIENYPELKLQGDTPTRPQISAPQDFRRPSIGDFSEDFAVIAHLSEESESDSLSP